MPPGKLDNNLLDVISKDLALETCPDDIPTSKRLETDYITAVNNAALAFQKPSNISALIALWRFYLSGPLAGVYRRVEEVERQLAECGKQRQAHLAEAEKFLVRMLLVKAKLLIAEAEAAGKEKRYRFQGQWFERAMTILTSLFEGRDNPVSNWRYPAIAAEETQARDLIARCYLRRGQAILPTLASDGVAATLKREAFAKGLVWLAPIPSPDIDALLCKVILLHETSRLGEEVASLLYEAVKALCANGTFQPKTPEEWRALFLHGRASKDKGALLDVYKQAGKYLDSTKSPPPYLHTLRARAAVCRGVDSSLLPSSAINAAVNEALTFLEKQIHWLVSPAWDEIIRLLTELKVSNLQDSGSPLWAKASCTAWQHCQKVADNMAFGLEIRQYWGRLQRLYLLAYEGFLALGKYTEAARCADSFKSRTTLSWRQVEAALTKLAKNKPEIRQLLQDYADSEVQAGRGFYVDKYQELRDQIKKLIPKKARQGQARLETTDIPEGWVAVHLTLVEEDNGTLGCSVLWGKKKKGSVSWEESRYKSDKVNTLYQAWRQWSDRYWQCIRENQDPLDGSSYQLLALCQSIHEALPILMEIAKTNPDGIIFIPHGFLHQLPLHGAYDGEKFLFERTPSVYLPAWSYAAFPAKEVTKLQRDNWYFDYFASSTEQAGATKFYSSFPWPWHHGSKRQATFDDIKKANTIWEGAPPAWLVLQCHGKADPVNPFNTLLRFGLRGLTYQELLAEPLALTGTRVMLGVCETELATERTGQPDEHLSFAGLFLNQGACLVLGALWECYDVLVEDIMNKASYKPLWKVIQERQQAWLKVKNPLIEGILNEHRYTFPSLPQQLHLLLPFRMLGYPHQPVPTPVAPNQQADEVSTQ